METGLVPLVLGAAQPTATLTGYASLISTRRCAPRAFREDYPEAEAALLYRGQDRLRMNDIWCLPIDDFLRRIVPKRGLLDWLPN